MKTLRLAGGLVLGSALLVSTSAGAAGGPPASAAAWPRGRGPLVPLGAADPGVAARWPAAAEQLARDRVVPGSALEKLILANQDFSLLRPGEAADGNPIPPWLRVLWHKAHPRARYAAGDPTGGYPLVLRDLHEWMLRHQDLVRGSQRPLGRTKAAVSEGGEQRISGAAAEPRSESAIRVNPFDPSKVIAASNDIGGSGEQAIFYSTDGGTTWGQSSLPLRSDDLFQSDPAVEWTSDGTAWSAAIAISAAFSLHVRAYKSTDNGVTWTLDATVSGSEQLADKEMIRADHGAASPFKDNLYAIWHDDFWVLMARRTGPHGRWQNPILVSGTETTGTGIGGDVTTNAAGDVFGFWPDTYSRSIYVVKSTDGGASFGPARRVASTFGAFQVAVPADHQRRALIYVSSAAYRAGGRNAVYAAWNDLSGESGCAQYFSSPGANAGSGCKTRIWFARSTDGGSTWSPAARIFDPGVLDDQFFPALTLDEATGRLGIVYYDTIQDASRLTTRLFYQSSDDGGTTWSIPSQVSSASTNETVAGADSGNQYGDYISLNGAGGLLFPSWTDRRSGGREEIWSAAISDPGSCSSTAVVSLAATPKGDAGVALTWSPVPGATYEIYRAGASGGPYSLIATSAASSWFDRAGPCDATRYYAVRVLASCSSALSNEVSYGNRPSVAVYGNDFETINGGLSDWVVGTMANVGTSSDWWGIQACLAHGGHHSFRFGSPSCQGGPGQEDLVSAQPGGASGIAVPPGASLTRLSFWHDYDFLRGKAGGALAFSISPGVNYLVPPLLVAGQTYDLGKIGSLCSPGYSLDAFTGSSGGFVNTTVDLDSLCTFAGAPGCGGANVAIGFLGITDCSSAPQAGWYLDDVVVTTCPAVAAPALLYYTLPPCRLIDTRNAASPLGGPALAPQATRGFMLAGSCGVPATARAVAVNVTVANPAAGGALNLFADDQLAQLTSVISFAPGQVRGNSAVLALGQGSGGIRVANSTAGTVDLILDVNGYFQ
jgi:hypothetical protein